MLELQVGWSFLVGWVVNFLWPGVGGLSSFCRPICLHRFHRFLRILKILICYAAMAAIIITTAELHIRTDCSYVHINLSKLLKHKTTNLTSWNHRDLWLRIQTDITTRNRVIEVEKVKGHATLNDVDSGMITRIIMCGNRAADKLATDGANLITPDKNTQTHNHHKFKITATPQISGFGIRVLAGVSISLNSNLMLDFEL